MNLPPDPCPLTVFLPGEEAALLDLLKRRGFNGDPWERVSRADHWAVSLELDRFSAHARLALAAWGMGGAEEAETLRRAGLPSGVSLLRIEAALLSLGDQGRLSPSEMDRADAWRLGMEGVLGEVGSRNRRAEAQLALLSGVLTPSCFHHLDGLGNPNCRWQREMVARTLEEAMKAAGDLRMLSGRPGGESGDHGLTEAQAEQAARRVVLEAFWRAADGQAIPVPAQGVTPEDLLWVSSSPDADTRYLAILLSGLLSPVTDLGSRAVEPARDASPGEGQRSVVVTDAGSLMAPVPRSSRPRRR